MKIRLTTWLFAFALAVSYGQPFDEVNDRNDPDAPYVDGAEATVFKPARMPGIRLGVGMPAPYIQLPRTERPDVPYYENVEQPEAQPSGYSLPAPPGLLRGAHWKRLPSGGHVTAIEFYSENAQALRVQMTDFGKDGVELRVYDPKGGYTFGPYRTPILNEDGTYWTTIIFGDSIGLEFFAPPDLEGTPQLPEIVAFNYNYHVPFSDFFPQGCSHRDVTCEAAWANEARAVTMLARVSGGGLSSFCSGALLNRNPTDAGANSPIVLTANHCVGTTTTANTTSFVWLYQTPNCNGTAPNPNSLPRSDGALLLKRHSSSDWNILGSYEPPGASYYLGWDSDNSWSNGSFAAGIHHPGGSFKRFSSGTKTGSGNRTFCDSNGNNCFDADVWNVEWTTGFTQPGSSGSPLMDGARRVRGTLTGGPSDDCTVSRYGRFHNAFGTIRYFLYEMASPTYVDNSVAGDGANNAGSTERGTAGNPFNSVYEATFCVPTGGTVRIDGGNYNQRFTLWRPMTLRSDAGTVRIGTN
ncbi:MAG: hypothetical protein KIT45_04240 [Fimbriimonadia bacterium]|nr:hypothetical protein [Fimbriimonadia bacterium]